MGYALKLSDGDAQAAELLVRWAECMAANLIERHWFAVHKLAFALRSKEKYSGESLSSDEMLDLLGREGHNSSD